MKSARINLMETYILEKQSVTLNELTKTFSISITTARRDLNILTARGKIIKIYGGAKAADTHSPHSMCISFSEREQMYTEEKALIGKIAAQHIFPGDVVYIDSSTTCAHIISFLSEINCMIITNSLQIANLCLPYKNLAVLMLPGNLNRETLSFSDTNLADYISTLNINKAFMSATGANPRSGLTTAYSNEHLVKRTICSSCNQIYLLSDHGKFEKTALYTYYRFEDIDTLITDRKPSDEIITYCSKHQIRILY